MQTFIKALVTYFACDGTTAGRMLTADEAADCARSYEALRASFLSDEERRALDEGPTARAAALRTGYRRFLDWMAQNPERVGRLRRAARAIGGRTAT